MRSDQTNNSSVQPTLTNGKLMEYRLIKLETKVDDLQRENDLLQDHISQQDVVIATLKERLSIFSLAQATLTIIIGAVAAVIGRSS